MGTVEIRRSRVGNPATGTLNLTSKCRCGGIGRRKRDGKSYYPSVVAVQKRKTLLLRMGAEKLS